jgi:hypothetical protein
MMWLCSGATDNPEDNTVMEKHGAEALFSTVKSWMQDISTEDVDAQEDVAPQMIQIPIHGTTQRWSESKVENGKPLVLIPK